MKGGIVTQVKQPKVLNFIPLREAIKDPGDFLLSDFSKFDRPPLLHLAFQALDRFSSQAGRFPLAGSEEDVKKLVEIAVEIKESLDDARLEDVNPKLLRHLAFGSRAVLNPMAAMFGGIVGQEVGNSILSFSSFTSIHWSHSPRNPLMHQILVHKIAVMMHRSLYFRSTLQKKLEDAKVFFVGAGALGCEFLYNLVLMGVSCGTQGKLTV